MEKWVIAAKRADFNQIGQQFHIDPVIARLIRNRDVIGEDKIREYLSGTVQELPSPWLMKDMEKAVDILEKKISQKAKVRIIGDYDIDGVTSTYILMKGLARIGADVDTYIPDRVADGYGIHAHLIERAETDRIDTIVTCDNGIAAAAEIQMAKDKGMTVIITDHHEVPYREEKGERQMVLPPADAILNPKQYDCPYPNKNLCGAVVAFKYIAALYERFGVPAEELEDYYELMNDWYLKGYMTDENFAFTSDSDDSDYMAAGKLFALAKYSNTADEMGVTLGEAGCDYRLVQLTDIISNQPGAKHLQTTAGWRGLFVPKSCSDPVAAYNFMKFMYSEEGQCLSLWGEEGTDWNWDEEHSYPVLNYDFESPTESDGMKFWGWIYHDGVRNTLPGYGNEGQTFKAREAATSISETNPVLGMLRMGADSEEQTIMNNLVELYNNMTAQIITASTPEESKALYQEMLSTAKSMGADKLDQWADSKYAEKKAAYDEIKDVGADY